MRAKVTARCIRDEMHFTVSAVDANDLGDVVEVGSAAEDILSELDADPSDYSDGEVVKIVEVAL